MELYNERSILWTFLSCLLLMFTDVSSVTVEEDLTLVGNQGSILDQFAELMKPKLDEQYMQESIYLIRWLRATNFDIEAAEKMLTNDLRWRRENNINNIDNEDWSYFEEDYAYSVDTIDKTGRPILYFEDSAKWDVRQAVVSGQKAKLTRWMVKMMEDATKRVRELQNQGHNVTRWGQIFNLGYFNLIQGGCLQCLSVYTEFITNYEFHYPNTANKITLINTPGIFEVVLRVIRPLMSPSTRESLAVYGINKVQWQQALSNEISKNELPDWLGGKRSTKGV